MDPETLVTQALLAGASTGPDDAASAAVQEFTRELVTTAALDPHVVRLARQVMEQLDLRGAQGVQVGDHNTQHNTFG